MINLHQLRNKSPREFEEYITKLLPKLGYSNINLTSPTADSGYDIEAYKDNKKVLFECKRYNEQNKVGTREVRIFADTCRRFKAEKGVFITTSSFTRMVYQEQNNRAIEIEFWDGKELLRQIMNSKNIEAYCVQCKTPLKGFYKAFDWKEDIAKKPKISTLKYNSEKMIKNIWTNIIYEQKGNLVPKNPRLCEKCEFWYTCLHCEKDFDVRKKPLIILTDFLKKKSYRIARKFKIYPHYLCLDCYEKMKKIPSREITELLLKKKLIFKKKNERSDFIEALKVYKFLVLFILIWVILSIILIILDKMMK